MLNTFYHILQFPIENSTIHVTTKCVEVNILWRSIFFHRVEGKDTLTD